MKRKGFTLIELLVVVAIIALLISILLPSLARARELSKRAVCAANVRGIGQASKIYANDFNERWPIAPYIKKSFRGIGPIGDLPGQYYQQRIPPGQAERIPENPSISRCFWILVKAGGTSAKQFVCPSSGGAPDDIPNPLSYYDFYSEENVSYGYQYPYTSTAPGVLGNRAIPSEARDPGMPMVADGNLKDFLTSNPYAPPNGSQDFFNRSSNTQNWWKPDDWKQVNSENHSNAEGQNVLYADGHATFENRAACGLPVGVFPVTNRGTGQGTPYDHPDLIYWNLEGVYGGILTNNVSETMPVDPNDSVIVHQGKNVT